MEKLLWKAYQGLAETYDCTLIGPPGCTEFLNDAQKHIASQSQGVAGFLWHATHQSLRITREKKFDLVIGGSGLVAPVLWLLQKLKGINSSCFIHGLDLVVINTLYQTLFVPCIRHLGGVICNSSNTARIATSKGVHSNKICVINPGVETNTPIAPKSALKNMSKIGGHPIVLSAGRLIKRKGILPFVEHCLPKVVEEIPNVRFVVIGGEPTNAIKKEQPVTETILDAARRQNIENNIVMLGKTDDKILLSAYAEAEVFVFPLIDVPGDIEGFGMVALEAAAQGLPTVAFDCGSVSDAVIDGKTGWLIEPDNYDAMAKTIIESVTEDNKRSMHDACIAHAQSLNWDQFNHKLNQHVKGLLS